MTNGLVFFFHVFFSCNPKNSESFLFGSLSQLKKTDVVDSTGWQNERSNTKRECFAFVGKPKIEKITVNHQGEINATGWMLMKSEHCDSQLKLAVELQLGYLGST